MAILTLASNRGPVRAVCLRRSMATWAQVGMAPVDPALRGQHDPRVGVRWGHRGQLLTACGSGVMGVADGHGAPVELAYGAPVATLTAGMVAACAGITSAPGGGVVTFAEDIGLPSNCRAPLTSGEMPLRSARHRLRVARRRRSNHA